MQILHVSATVPAKIPTTPLEEMKVTLTNTWTNILMRKITGHWHESMHLAAWLQNPKHTSRWSPCRGEAHKSHKLVSHVHNPMIAWSQNAQKPANSPICKITYIHNCPLLLIRRDDMRLTKTWTNILTRTMSHNWHQSMHLKLNFRTRNVLRLENHPDASSMKVINWWVIHYPSDKQGMPMHYSNPLFKDTLNSSKCKNTHICNCFHQTPTIYKRWKWH